MGIVVLWEMLMKRAGFPNLYVSVSNYEQSLFEWVQATAGFDNQSDQNYGNFT